MVIKIVKLFSLNSSSEESRRLTGASDPALLLKEKGIPPALANCVFLTSSSIEGQKRQQFVLEK